jgi:hypothetical protein
MRSTGAVPGWSRGLDHHTRGVSLSQAALPDSEPFGKAPVDASRIAAGDSCKRYERLRERVLFHR